LETTYQERYASLTDDELLHIAGDRPALCDEAISALDSEMSKRGLTHEQVRVKGRDERRFEAKNARARRPKPKPSKYFVAKLRLPWFLLGLLGLLLLMFLLMGQFDLSDEWSEPVFVVYIAAFIACLAVQPWIRKNLRFWLALAISSIPEFAVSHWLALNYSGSSRYGLKVRCFLSLLVGYPFAAALFILFEKLKPTQPSNTTQ
jgi:hypothetical protein